MEIQMTVKFIALANTKQTSEWTNFANIGLLNIKFTKMILLIIHTALEILKYLSKFIVFIVGPFWKIDIIQMWCS